MAERQIYLMRHGSTVRTGVKRLVGRFDAPLDEAGLALARQVAGELAGAAIGRVVCSPLARSAQMGRLIAPALGAALHVEPDLAEIDLGAWDGLPVAEIEARWPGEFQRRGAEMETYRPPGGESFGDLRARAVAAFGRVADALPGNLLLIGHRSVNRAILGHILGLPPEKEAAIPQAHGQLYRITEWAGTPRFTVET